MKPQRHRRSVAFSENKHKIYVLEYNLLFGVDVGVIFCYVKKIPRLTTCTNTLKLSMTNSLVEPQRVDNTQAHHLS